MDEHEDIDEFLKKLRERNEKRQAKLYPQKKQEVSIDSMTTCSEREDVSYPPLSPLPEEENDSIADTDPQDGSSLTEYKRENSPPSQLDYSSDLSLECDDDNTTTASNDYYRAEPVVCHNSPDQVLQHAYGLAASAIRSSPRKMATAPPASSVLSGGGSIGGAHSYQQQHNKHAPTGPVPTPAARHQLAAAAAAAAAAAVSASVQQQRNIEPAHSNPLHERQLESASTVVGAAAAAAAAAAVAQVPSVRPTSDEQLMRELSRKIDRAENSIKQLSKAVTYSKIGTKEHIEAARLLKIAQVEMHDFRLHKHKLDNGIRKKADSLGSLRLFNIGFETRTSLKDDLALEGVFHYFFCIASCGPEVKATETIDTDSIRAQNQKDYLLFTEELTFADLPPDFTVELQLFEYVKKPMKFVERTLEALSTPKKSRPTTETEFHRVGFIKLTKEDRRYDEPKTLKFENGSKYINKRFRFQMELKPEQLPTKVGMLHVRRLDGNGLPDWSRFWIDLSKGEIRFWKSKQDALDKLCPNHKIELKDLCSENVQKLTPDDDLYRQNSFVLYVRTHRLGGESDTLLQRITDDKNYKIVKHQFAADNKEDRDSWCALLDKSMHCFREWNGKSNVQGVDELKELFDN